MSHIRSTFTNLKGHQIESSRRTIKVDERYYQREPHGIQQGIRKDKKIKMNHKIYN
ncbi:hypothetical protein [Romboutsia weinsteinii]|uniref:hypothetical protein n=1 Tax=Romboutsia weinsteinii TaxID=2020949 RepID=UPI0013148FB4|nr:hypothetical protein [Romboutsia weinsteinii]